jgi:GTP pyrophosphokinase
MSDLEINGSEDVIDKDKAKDKDSVIVLDKDPSIVLDKAYAMAVKVHQYQKRDDGAPYMTHIDGVLSILRNECALTRLKDYTILAVASLHDVLEDSDSISYQDLVLEFGLEIAQEVKLLTKTKDMSLDQYLGKMKAYTNPYPLINVKLADRLHNVRSLKLITKIRPEKVSRYIKETQAYYLPLSLEYGILKDALQTALDEVKKSI